VIPLFKTHSSIGKSILTLDDPDSEILEGGLDSIFSLVADYPLERLVLVEDSLVGYLRAFNKCEEIGQKLSFGLRLSVRNSELPEDELSEHKIIVFAKNNKICQRLNKIYSKSAELGFLTYEQLKGLWVEEDLFLAIPFYDSFIFNNTMKFANCVPNYVFTKPVFFIENNDLPFDELIKNKVILFCEKGGFEIFETKTIYYKSRADVRAFQTYKILCSRSSFKKSSLTKPNLEHFGSREFCWESFLEKK